ncbi:MAG: sugar ABC transporter permease [Cohnella sp.]|uniref:carbohydrate ABC transporter permease n=1 Tax=Cohnella sp. TaxID=1883426 RepID=UPI000E39D281|nr:sugar ABC transporter permease [Cohnella sp.]REK67136.1 MAG: sugar ABC transporter permease [Cohnella sp.]
MMKRAGNRSEMPWVALFTAPWLLSFAVFLAYPMYLAFRTSFLQVNFLEPEKAKFVGFGNIVQVISDAVFWRSLFNVIYNQAIFISLSFVIALFLAVMLFEIRRGAAFFRTVYFLPIITSVTVAIIIFNNLTNTNGPIQSLLVSAGLLDEPVNWKFTQWLPMPILALFNSWKWFGIQMIILLGGLAGINEAIVEAAKVDGAGWWRRLFSILIPQLKPQIVFVLTMNLINGLQMFSEVFLVFDLEGGPYHAGLTPVLYLYKTGFKDMQMGYASAIGIVLAVIIFALTNLQLKLANRG